MKSNGIDMQGAHGVVFNAVWHNANCIVKQMIEKADPESRKAFLKESQVGM